MVRLAMVVGALGATLLASGCGSADVAARFDGHTVTETEVNTAVHEINEAFKPAKPYTGQAALTSLVRAPYLIDYAEKHGYPQTVSAAVAQIPLHDPSPATIDIVRANAVIDHLTEADQVALTKVFNDLKVDVNPKYGTYDPTRAAMGTGTPDWLEFHSADS